MIQLSLTLHHWRKQLASKIPYPLTQLFRRLLDSLGLLLIGYILLNISVALIAYFLSGQAVLDMASLMAGSCQASPRSCQFETLYVAVGIWILTGFDLVISMIFIFWRWVHLPPATTDELSDKLDNLQHQIDTEVLPRLREQ